MCICVIFCVSLCPRRTSGGILKSHRPSVRYKWCLSDSSSTTEANLMKLHRKIKHNEKECRAQLCQRSKSCLSNDSKRTEANLTKLHRNIEHSKKVCCLQELGSYAKGQGHNHVRGHIVPKIVLLINYRSKFDANSQKDKA